MNPELAIKTFCLNNLSIELEIRRIEAEYDVNLGHGIDREKRNDQTYYPQFAEKLRNEAARMSDNYAVFYCLENSIRDIIVKRLQEAYGVGWWDKSVPEKVRGNAEVNYKKERSAGVTMRSEELIDFTNFGELGEIIKANWDIFGDMFQDVTAVQKILATLNTLRAPIAHCKALVEHEERRLDVGLGDWFSQME